MGDSGSKVTRPTHFLVITDKGNSKHRTRAGALFKSDYGFSLRLNPGVRLDWTDEVYLNFVPTEYKNGALREAWQCGPSESARPARGPLHTSEDANSVDPRENPDDVDDSNYGGDDDIPF